MARRSNSQTHASSQHFSFLYPKCTVYKTSKTAIFTYWNSTLTWLHNPPISQAEGGSLQLLFIGPLPLTPIASLTDDYGKILQITESQLTQMRWICIDFFILFCLSWFPHFPSFLSLLGFILLGKFFELWYLFQILMRPQQH